MCNLFTENYLISSNQTGFRPGDSCINQVLAITYTIFKSFDELFVVRGVFLDISKAFDKVWHEGLLLRLNQNCISGNLLKRVRNSPSTSSSKWSVLILGCYGRSSTGFYFRALIISYLHK